MNEYSNFPLKITAKPPAFHGKTVRQNVTQSLWRKLREKTLIQYDSTCSICGFNSEEKRKLHVHEVEEYDLENGICELLDLNLICVKCHAFQHMGRTKMVSTKEQMNDLIQHFTEVNMCDRIDYDILYLQVANDHAKYRHDVLTFDKVRYRITGDIPLKKEVIIQLKEKDLWVE